MSARTTRVPDQFANGGAVHQDGKLPIYECNTCHGQVVWATSKRTGRKYLANIRTGYLDQRFYSKADIHDCENPARRGYMGIAPAGSEERTQTNEIERLEALKELNHLMDQAIDEFQATGDRSMIDSVKAKIALLEPTTYHGKDTP